MCDYTGADFGAPYPDAACHAGFLWDLDCDGWGGGDFSHPCPKCNTVAYLDDAKDDAECTSHGSYQWHRYSGAMIIEGAVKKAREENPEAARVWCAAHPTIQTFDWPDRAAVLAGKASPEHCPEAVVQTIHI